jgi:hypothetical protein
VRNFFFFIFLIPYAYSNSPDWIKEPIKYCLNSEICVLGSGKTLEKATLTAREELAKVLKVKIIGNTIFNTYSRQIRENEAVEGNVSENFNKGIEEISEEILEGTFVKETFKDSENIFVLMALDKLKTSLIIKNRILSIDENIEHLYQLGRRASLFEAIKTFPLRDDLDSRYEYLTGEKIVPKVTIKQLYNQKERYFKKQTKVFLNFIDFKNDENLKSFIVSNLLELGLVQVLDPDEKNAYEVKFFFKFKKSYFNVEGFEKYQFTLTAYSYNRNKIKIGILNFSTDGIGRNFIQAKENALTKIKQFVHDNINQMNID